MEQMEREKLMFVDPCIIVQFIHKNPTRCNSGSKFIISYLYEVQHVSGDIAPIIRSLKLHWQPLVLHTWKVVGRCQAVEKQHCARYQPSQRPATKKVCKTRDCNYSF